MEMILDKKDKKLPSLRKNDKLDYVYDHMIQDYYIDYYQNLSSKELDKEFNKDILTLTKALSKLPESERKNLIEILSNLIEFYIENKIEKELNNSIFKIMKF